MTGPYRAWPQGRRIDGPLTLRAVEPADIEPIRQWRNAQMDVLRQSAPITQTAQIAYFAAQVWPDKDRTDPTQILVAIERGGVLVGYGGLVHISWPNLRAEVSFLLTPDLEADPAARDPILALYLAMIKCLAFDDLGLQRLTTETYATRGPMIAALEHAGFECEGRLRQHVVIGSARVDALVHGCNAPAPGAPD